jgi:hypothetical protein
MQFFTLMITGFISQSQRSNLVEPAFSGIYIYEISFGFLNIIIYTITNKAVPCMEPRRKSGKKEKKFK